MQVGKGVTRCAEIIQLPILLAGLGPGNQSHTVLIPLPPSPQPNNSGSYGWPGFPRLPLQLWKGVLLLLTEPHTQMLRALLEPKAPPGPEPHLALPSLGSAGPYLPSPWLQGHRVLSMDNGGLTRQMGSAASNPVLKPGQGGQRDHRRPPNQEKASFVCTVVLLFPGSGLMPQQDLGALVGREHDSCASVS